MNGWVGGCICVWVWGGVGVDEWVGGCFVCQCE